MDALSQSLPSYKEGAEINFGWLWIKKRESKFKITVLASLAAMFTLEFIGSMQPQNMIEEKLLSLFDFSEIEILYINAMPELRNFLKLLPKANFISLSKLRQLWIFYTV